jgi:sugar/nucleoside kinase (ribokinase family)
MSLLVVGSIALDTIKTPVAGVDEALGGSCVYFSLAASFLTDVRLVGVVGDDFPEEHLHTLESRGVSLDGLKCVQGGQTFRWSGEYFDNMNRRETLSVSLNVLEDFEPKIPDSYRTSEFVFLANASPLTQMSVLDQVKNPRFVMADTMDLWIQTHHDQVLELLKKIHGVIINDDEALLLTNAPNVVEAGNAILELGPSRVIIKKGEHGAILFTRDGATPLPAFPLIDVRDPTGAGDSFAGGLMGHLARYGDIEPMGFKRALAHGVVISSLCCEDFGVRHLTATTTDDVEVRYRKYREMLEITDQ